MIAGLSDARWRESSPYFDKLAEELEERKETALKQVSVECVPGVPWQGGFLVHNLLSQQECAALMEAAEKHGFKQREFAGDGTDSASSICDSPALTKSIYERLANITVPNTKDNGGNIGVPFSSYQDACSGIVLDEFVPRNSNENIDNPDIKWGTLWGMNTSVRVERYDAGQNLKIHRDGCVRVPGTEGRIHTVFAVLIYLNKEAYEGGPTRFAISKSIDKAKPGEPYPFVDVDGQTGSGM